MSQITRTVKHKFQRINGGYVLLIIAALVLFAFFYLHATTLRFCDISSESLQLNNVTGMKNGAVYRQDIVSIPNKNLSGISLRFGTYKRTNHGEIKMTVYEDDVELSSWKVSTTKLTDNEPWSFLFLHPHQMKEGAHYYFTVSEHYRGQNAVAIWSDKDGSNTFSIDGEVQDKGTIYYTLMMNSSPTMRIIIIVAVLVMLLALALMMLRVDERVIMIALLAILLTFYLIACPPGMAPDEWVHFYRGYEIAQGELITPYIENVGGRSYLPSAIMLFTDKTALIDWNSIEPINCSGAASYAPVGYLPQALGLRIAEIFTKHVYNVYYGGKIGMALMCLLLCGLALWITPYGRKMMFVIMTFPMAMQQMVTLSPDGYTIALSMFFLAYVLRLSYRAERVKARDIAILAIVGISLSLCKIVYVALLVLLFLIPTRKFSGKKAALLCRFGLILGSFAATLLWYRFAVKYTWGPSPDVIPAEQIKFLLFTVKAWMVVPVRSILTYGIPWIQGLVGAVLGSLSVPTQSLIWLVYLMLFIYEMCSCFIDDIEIRATDIFIMTIAFLGASVLAALAMYISWTPVGSETVDGVQGRYFLPALASLGFAYSFARSKTIRRGDVRLNDDRGNHGSYAYLMALCLNGMALIDVVKAFIYIA